MKPQRSGVVIILSAVALALIGVTKQVLDRSGNTGEGSSASEDEVTVGTDKLGLQKATSVSDSLVRNTPQEAATGRLASTGTSPVPESLHWPASEYEAVFGLGEPSSPLQKVHADFVDEPRDASWADAMEAGITQALVQSDATAKITVAYVECRSSICEVAGSMPAGAHLSRPDPYSLFPENLGEGWWQGRIDMGIGTYTYEGEGIIRFIVIIAEPTTFLAASEDH